MRDTKGFTLIEVIVVLVILAILMAVALPSVFVDIQKRGRKQLLQWSVEVLLLRQ